MRLAVYGLGRLGYPLFNVLARAGYAVDGIDPMVGAEGGVHIKSTEPGLKWPLEAAKSWVHQSPQPADVNFIVVPTPSLDKGDHRGGFDSAYVETALRHIRNVNKGTEATILRKPIAVIVSTLSPGTCEKLAKQFHTLSLVYNPTFIALGNVVKGLTEPDLVLIGGDDEQAINVVRFIWESVFSTFGLSDYPYHRVASFTEIELIKLSVNAVLGTKISMANSLGQLFAAYGVSPKAVEVIGHDPRIGPALMSPGSPISGPCLPRDNAALSFAATKVGYHLPIAQATDRVNWMLLDSIFNKVMEHNPGSVGILGMSYKYGVDVDTAAPGPWLYDQMKKKGIPCFTYDELMPSDSLEEVLGASDVIVVTQKEYRPLLNETDAKVVDLWA